jgi:hypothetical protein
VSTLQATAPSQTSGSVGKAWLRALELTAPIGRNRDRILSTVIEERRRSFKQSGMGRELGEYGLQQYTEVKKLTLKL